jgi:hypothetical protein
MLFAYEDKDLEGMQSDGILGLSNDKNHKNFLDVAKENGLIKNS